MLGLRVSMVEARLERKGISEVISTRNNRESSRLTGMPLQHPSCTLEVCIREVSERCGTRLTRNAHEAGSRISREE